MILDAQSVRIIADFHLLDDIISRAPGLDLQPVAELVHRLVVGAVYQWNPVLCACAPAEKERLNTWTKFSSVGVKMNFAGTARASS